MSTSATKTLLAALLLGTAIVPATSYAQDVIYADTQTLADDDGGDIGFSIAVDGEIVEGADSVVATSRRADVALEKLDIQVKFDGLDVKPTLNVATTDQRRTYTAGEAVPFLATSNYPAWIASSEMRIYEKGAARPLAVVPVDRFGHASWAMPATGGDEFLYVLRVYDGEGRFDETNARTLARSSTVLADHAALEPVSPGNGEDNTGLRNIPVHGGAVTVYGRNVPAGHGVRAIGETLPVDGDNSFVVQRILPPGDHDIDVAVTTGPHAHGKGDGIVVNRAVHIPANDWFYVAMADLTVGRRFGDAKLLQADPGEFEDTYTKGRLAFYLKGKIKGKYLLTAAADTRGRDGREGELRDLFDNLHRKDPRSLLRRIEPEDYYPVYGDDSLYHEDAPTNGAFYVRLERGDSHVMWGNFKTKITGSKFVRSERGLYGASAVHRSTGVTAHGERKIEVEAYASEPDTLPRRDTMRGTGGSAYFLSRQDITTGSEQVTVETRDILTGQITSRRALQYGKDYTIDYVQGVIILKTPLQSTARDGGLIRDGALGDQAANLVVQYEFAPALGDVDAYSYGGRAQAWVGDNVRVGVSGMNEENGDIDSRVVGADVRVRLGENSFVTGEIAQSDGAGISRTSSLNGGLTINDKTGRDGGRAQAVSLAGQIDLADFDTGLKGVLGAYYERRERGFNSLDYTTDTTQRVFGVHATVAVTDDVTVAARYEDFADDTGRERREGGIDVKAVFDERWSATVGVQHTDQSDPARADRDGSRTTVGAQLTRRFGDGASAWVFGQATVRKSGTIDRNDRIGVGASAKLTDRLSLTGEASTGKTGAGGEVTLNYAPTADDEYYIGYRLDPDRATDSTWSLYGVDRGGVVVGMKRRHNEHLSSYGENNYDMFGSRLSLTSTYGVIYTPTDHWTLNGGFERGTIEDRHEADLERTAVSLALGYKRDDALSWRLKGEARFEDSDDFGKDRNTYLVAGAISQRTSEDWRLFADLDAVVSRSGQSDILDGDYVEAQLGFAYRPVDNDRWNVLAKYAYLHDLPGIDQVNAVGERGGPSQKSHILSVDASYDVNQWLTVGGKYGYRTGEVSTRAGADFDRATAHLAILRADVHVLKKWDIVAEARMLATPSTDTTNAGVLAAAYYHVGDSFKVGLGYNFAEFSDDLRDLTYDDQGMFLNVVGKF